MATMDRKGTVLKNVKPIVSVGLPANGAVLHIRHIARDDNVSDAEPGMHISLERTGNVTKDIPLPFIESFRSVKINNVLDLEPLVSIKAYNSLFEARGVRKGDDPNILKPGAYYRWDRPYGSVLVPVIVDSDGTVRILMQQVYRHQIAASGWEFPMGGLNKDETRLDGAKREMREETGMEPKEVTQVIDGYTDPGTSTARETFYVGSGLREVGGRVDENERIGNLTAFDLNEALRMLDNGEIDRLETATGILSVYRMVREGKLRGVRTERLKIIGEGVE